MAGLSALIALLASFGIVALSSPLIRKYALRMKLGDKPNGRKLHRQTIPHLGGIGLVLGAVGSLALVRAVSGGGVGALGFPFKMMWPVLLIVALGLFDDLKNLKALHKLTVQAVSALLLAALGFHLQTGLAAVDGVWIFTVLLTAFYLVGTSSSVNLIDGHDGLAAGLCVISGIGFALIGFVANIPLPAVVSLALVGVSLGFLVYNFPPGKIFMGDTGSMFLGIMLGVIACFFTMMRPSVHTFLAVCFVLSVPMLDSWLAIARRVALGRSIFQADCLHIHHIISSFGFSPRQTLAILYSLQILLTTLGILTMLGFVVPIVLGAVILLLAFVTFLRVMVAAVETEKTVAANFAHGSVPSLEK